jgi:hypothetical protein
VCSTHISLITWWVDLFGFHLRNFKWFAFHIWVFQSGQWNPKQKSCKCLFHKVASRWQTSPTMSQAQRKLWESRSDATPISTEALRFGSFLHDFHSAHDVGILFTVGWVSQCKILNIFCLTVISNKHIMLTMILPPGLLNWELQVSNGPGCEITWVTVLKMWQPCVQSGLIVLLKSE